MLTPATKTLLMLAFEFPPLGGVGVQRSLKLAKYLHVDGIKPVVVTTDNASLEAWFGQAQEYELLSDLPSNVAIYRVPCPRPRRARIGRLANWLTHFFSVDEDIGQQWEPHLVSVWDKLVAELKPAAVYVSIPPFSMAPLGVRLARRAQLPLIVDFRDNWSQFCCGARPSWMHYQLLLRRERICVEGAAAIVGVTGQLIRDLQAAHPHVAREKFHVIQNGYDGVLVAPAVEHSAEQLSDPFVIGYVGSFYYTPEARATVMEPWWRRPPKHWLHYAPRREDWLYRSPYFFFQALKLMFANSPALRSRVKVRFVGASPDWLRRQIEHFGLADVVELLGRRPHRYCLAFQARCDALLITSAKVIGGRDYCIAGKTFEYVASGRPIIAVVTEGEQREFLLDSGIASVCDADDPTASAKTLEEMVVGRFFFTPNLPFLRRFHRRETSRKLASLLHKSTEPVGDAAT